MRPLRSDFLFRPSIQELESRRLLFGSWFSDRYNELENGARDLGGEVSGAWHRVIDTTTKNLMLSNLGKYVSDWSETSFFPPGSRTGLDVAYFVNGMSTSRSGAEIEAQALANHIQREVRLIYNGTSGWVSDLGEAYRDKFWFPPVWQHNATTRELAGMLYNAARNGRQVSLVAHSQGTIIANNAMKTLSALGYGSWLNSSLALVMTGAPLWNFEVSRPAKFKRYDNPGDGIANWLGERLDNWYGKFPVSQYSAQHDFTTKYANRISQADIFGQIRPLLPDAWESNNTSSTARDLGIATPTKALYDRNLPLNIHTSTDVDWLKFSIQQGPGGRGDALGISFNSHESDLDLFLYRRNSDGSLTQVGSSTGTGNEEEISLQGLDVGTYFLKITSFNNRTATYSLSYEISPDGFTPDRYEKNNLRSSATYLDSIDAVLGAGGGLTGLNIHQPGDVDWYYIDADTWPSAGTKVAIDFVHANGDLDMELYRLDSGILKRIASSTSTTNRESISLAYLPPGRYYLKIFGYGDAINLYSISYDFPGGGLPADSIEPNDNNRLNARNIFTFEASSQVFYDTAQFPKLSGIGVEEGFITSRSTIHSATDVDWIMFSLNSWGRRGDSFYVRDFMNSQGDIDLQLYNSAGEVVRSSTSTQDFEVIPLDGLAPGDYWIKIYGHNGSLNWYSKSASFEGINEDSYEISGGNSLLTARPLGRASRGIPLIGYLDSDPSIHNQTDVDWYAISWEGKLTSDSHLAIDFFPSESAQSIDSGDLDLELYDAGGALIRSSTGIAGTELINLTALPAGNYYVKVLGFLGATNLYGLRHSLRVENSAPVMNNSLEHLFPSIKEDYYTSTGKTVLSLVSGVTDIDARALRGVAIISTTGTTSGRWQYTLNGGTTWIDVGAVTTSSALLLPSNSTLSKLRYVPNANFHGVVRLGYRAWDQTQGTVGSKVNAAVAGGTSAFSNAVETATMTINPVNDAPVMNTALDQQFPAIMEDNFGSTGKTVLSLVSGVTDVDTGALRGVAIVSATGISTGRWQYTLNGGTTWVNLGTVATSSALLLPSNGTLSKLRYVPNANFHGVVRLSYRAWDQTVGTVGSKASAASVGGTSAFSTAVETATLTINPVNDAPVMNTALDQQFPTITEDNFNSTGKTILSLVTGATDIDAGALRGVAIISATGATTGRWQYTLSGGTTWIDVGAVTTSSALLLPSNGTLSKLRYVPNANFHGVVRLGYRAWDQTQGTVGSKVNAAVAGGTSAFSNAVETATLTINPVNDAPVMDTALDQQFPAIMQDNFSSTGKTVLSLVSGVTDVDTGALRGVAIVSTTGTTTGRWQYTLNGGATWIDVGTVATSSALLLPSNGTLSKLRYVPNANFHGVVRLSYRAWDQTLGTVGSKASAASAGGTSAYSTAVETAAQTVSRK